MRLKEIFAQLDAVSGEHRITRLAVERLRDSIAQDPTIARTFDLKRSDIAEKIHRLEQTYIIRLFAAFEAALRDLWLHAFHRTTEPPVRDLIAATASANSFMPPSAMDRVQQIRELRNSIVHLNAAQPSPLSLMDSLRHLKTFLSFMPRQW